MLRELPTGTVTFLFTDVEGSTQLLVQLGAGGYAQALSEHRRVIREACGRHDGAEVDTQGDAFFFAFPTAPGALSAAMEFTEQLASDGAIRVRVGLHTGTPLLAAEGYVGHDVHRAARIAAAGHGGQVLVSASTAPLVDVALKDLGEHRFKDLGAPERVFQVGVDEFPSLKSMYRTNLPVPATPFLGRERELEEVAKLLLREDVRLVVLTGPGGSGKTRLLIQAAAEASEFFPHGTVWIPLAPLRDESALGATFALALEVRDQPGLTAEDSIIRALAGKRVLLVVDNCEHLLGGAADVVGRLVEGCPSLVVVASSRERLGLRAERVYTVPPMLTHDAEQLFVERASAVDPGFRPDEHVTAICEALDELPLAIELAAARVRSLSTRTIRERLGASLGLLATRDRDVEARQRTLEATIEWSYDLLDDEERRILRSLSVFAGGCTLDAALAVAAADLDALASLVDKSLLRHRIDEAGQDRYWLLETIREFSASRLTIAGEEEQANALHSTFFLQHAARLLTRTGESTSDEKVDLYKSDAANFKVAHARALADGDAASALRLVRFLSRTLFRVRPFEESYSVALSSLALPGGDDDDRAYALVAAANVAVVRGEIDAARDLLDDADTFFEQLDDREGLAAVLSTRSTLATVFGDPSEAMDLAKRLGQLGRELGNEWVARLGDLQLADALVVRALENGDLAAAERSRVLYAAWERKLPELGSKIEESIMYWCLGLLELAAGNHDESILHGRRSLLRMLDLGLTRAPDQLLVLGWAVGSRGDAGVGVQLVSAAMRECREDGISLERWMDAQMERFERSARRALGNDGYDAAVLLGEALSDDAANQLALTVTAAT